MAKPGISRKPDHHVLIKKTNQKSATSCQTRTKKRYQGEYERRKKKFVRFGRPEAEPRCIAKRPRIPQETERRPGEIISGGKGRLERKGYRCFAKEKIIVQSLGVGSGDGNRGGKKNSQNKNGIRGILTLGG